MGLADIVRDAGVVGSGGAGFPAHVKYSGRAEIFIINGAECEPLAHKDEAVLTLRPADIVVAAAAIRDELGAAEVILAVKETRASEIAGLYGGVKIYPLADVYPAGDEAVLVYEVTGRRVPADGFPPDVGVVVSNAETVLNAARAARGKSVRTTWVTVAGAVAEPFTAEVPVGTPASLLIDEAGGATVSDCVVLDGGPMMGEEINAETYGVKSTTGLISVLPGDNPVVRNARLPLQHVRTVAGSACTQCRDCTELCPRYLLGYDVTPHLSMRRFFAWGEEAEPSFFGHAAGCTGCGLCELYACPMAISPRRVQNYLRGRLEGATRAEGAAEVHADRPGRLVPARRLKVRIGVAAYDAPMCVRELRDAPTKVILNASQPYAPALDILVREGDRVEPGQKVAAPRRGDEMGVPVHASIGGRVAAVEGGEITIDRTQVA
ncbi:MAG TPA: 4Fe-4S dicluster domain-containing protein [bacterium]|nr:4Fe-4S dicluster domain-containing protein [bacterium]